MGKAIAYLIGAVVGFLLLRSTGMIDGIFTRGNVEERDAFWRKTVAAEAPVGTAKSSVEALMARHGVSLECFSSSITPPVADCIGDDASSKGGTSGHPVALQLRFTFHGETLAKFETNRHVLQ